VVAPNSRLHWALLVAGLAGAVGFNLTLLVDGALRPGYDALRQPMSALSLGPGGWVQMVNFIAYGLLGCVTAFAMRPTLAPGIGAVWYPRLRVVVGLALVGAGVFAQDPDNGFPVGVPVPAHPTVHAQLHLLASYISLTVIVAELFILGRRFAREPGWRGWAMAAWGSGVLLRRRLHHPPAGHP
jgi:hypothetical protein